MERRKKYIFQLSDREARNFDKYLKRKGLDTQDFIRSKIRYIVKDIKMDDKVDSIINECCIIADVKRGDVMSNCRKADVIVACKKVISYVLINKYAFTYKKVGEMMEGLDHSSIHYHCKDLEWYLKNKKMNMIPRESRIINHLKSIKVL